MSIDFDRTAGDHINNATPPLTFPGAALECWFQCDGWAGLEDTYGHLVGVYRVGLLRDAYLAIHRDAWGLPTKYYVEFTVHTSIGTFTSSKFLGAVGDGVWHHAIGGWQSSGAGNVAVWLDGVMGTAVAATGLIAGLNLFAMGYNGRTGADFFNGRIAECAAWQQDFASGTALNWLETAHCGLDPTDRDPFYFGAGPTPLKAWVPGHRLNVYVGGVRGDRLCNVRRPSASMRGAAERGVPTATTSGGDVALP
jgi:hypothetical protein